MSVETKPPIRYEDAAERRTDISGWICRACGRYFGDGPGSERAARYCCGHADMPCGTDGCPGRCETHRTCCDACRRRLDRERWEETPKVDWDGETPLCRWDGDDYFFDEDAVAEHIGDILERGGSLDDVRLVVCEPDEGRSFDMADYLSDSLPDDFDPPGSFAEIDGVVNDWMASHAPFSWVPGGKAVNVASLPMPLAGLTCEAALAAIKAERRRADLPGQRKLFEGS